MAFKECDEVMAGTTFVSLANDGDTAHLLFVGEPIPREEEFRGRTRHRAYFPVVTKDGLQVWGVGSKLYRRLRDAWRDYHKVCYKVTRVGESGSTATTYGLKKVVMPPVVKAKAKEVTPKVVKAFMVEVQAFGEGDEADDIPI